MNIDLIVGMILTLVVMSLLAWRFMLSKQEDDSVRLVHGTSNMSRQAMVAHRVEAVDKWGRLLTIVTVVYLIIIGSIYLYRYWIYTSTTITR
jgi:hypothetical protein